MADSPAFFDQNRFAFAPVTGINTAGIDVLPIEGLGMLPPVVPVLSPAIPPVPVSAVPSMREPKIKNTNPPFPVSPIAPDARQACEKARQGQSPLGQNEATNAGAGSPSASVNAGSETATR